MLGPATSADAQPYGGLDIVGLRPDTRDEFFRIFDPRFRRVLKSHDLGPQAANVLVAAYLEEERRLGRISPDVDCDASARLLVGACVNYAFTKMLLDDVEPSELFVEQAVRGLRIAP